MGQGNKKFEVEAIMWVRGQIPGETAEDAVSALMDLMYVKEKKLNKLSDHDYDVSMHGTSEQAGGLSGADLDDLRSLERKDKAAVALGRKGGAARAAKLHRKRRIEIARKAARKRWDKP